jgi:molecular chaperone DnaK
VTYALGVDVGTTYTAAAIWRDGKAETVPLGDRALAIPSALYLKADGGMLIGEAANRRGVLEPDRLARGFKRRLGDDAPLLLGDEQLSAPELTGHLIRWVVEKVSEREGGPPAHVTLTCPATWGDYRRQLMRQAAEAAQLTQVGLLPEPVAAAVYYASQERLAVGALVAVYDLGGGTFDASVVVKTDGGFELRGQPGGDETIGGTDFDQLVMDHVGSVLRQPWTLLDTADPAVLAGLAQVRDQAVAAKEALSSDTDATIPVILPGLTRDVRLTRGEFESAIRIPVLRTVDTLAQTIEAAGVTPQELTAVLLVGGSSRIPLVSRLLAGELGVQVAVDAHPKYAVCLGAAISAATRLPKGATAPPGGPGRPSAYGPGGAGAYGPAGAGPAGSGPGGAGPAGSGPGGSGPGGTGPGGYGPGGPEPYGPGGPGPGGGRPGVPQPGVTPTPGYGQPVPAYGTGQPTPGHGQPPGYGQPGYGQPGYGQPGYGRPGQTRPGVPMPGVTPTPGGPPPGARRPGVPMPGVTPTPGVADREAAGPSWPAHLSPVGGAPVPGQPPQGTVHDGQDSGLSWPAHLSPVGGAPVPGQPPQGTVHDGQDSGLSWPAHLSPVGGAPVPGQPPPGTVPQQGTVQSGQTGGQWPASLTPVGGPGVPGSQPPGPQDLVAPWGQPSLEQDATVTVPAPDQPAAQPGPGAGEELLAPDWDAPVLRADPVDVGVREPVDVPLRTAPDPRVVREISDRDQLTIEHTGDPNRGRFIALTVAAVVVILLAVASIVGVRLGRGGNVATFVAGPGASTSSAPPKTPAAGGTVTLKSVPVAGKAGDVMRALAQDSTGKVIAVGESSTEGVPRAWRFAGGKWAALPGPDAKTELRAGVNGVTASVNPQGFVAVGWTAPRSNPNPGARDRTGAIWVSADGLAFHPIQGLPQVGELSDVVARPGGGFLATGLGFAADPESGDGVLLTSPNGNQWTLVKATGLDGPGRTQLRRLLVTPTGLLALGTRLDGSVTKPGVWTSTDQTSWTEAALLPTEDGAAPSATALTRLADGTLVAAGFLSNVDRSRSALVWSGRAAAGMKLRAGAGAGAVFAAVRLAGDGGTMAVGTNQKGDRPAAWLVSLR